MPIVTRPACDDPRFPRLVKFREADKRAEDATTVEEIKKLYNQQFAHHKNKK